MSSALIERLEASGRAAGLDAFGVTTADVFDEALGHIEERKRRGLHAGMFFTYGRPERSTDPQRLLEGARSIIVGAVDYHRDVAEVPNGHARVARYVWERFYEQLRTSLEAVAEVLRGEGFLAEVVLDDNRLVDRAAAHRAGLGWFGKNTNLLLGELGSWFVLGSVITNAVLPTDDVRMDDGCGSCNRCQTGCPTGALDTAGVLDANRCLAWLVQANGVFPIEFREALGSRLYGCDECQQVCPPNTKYVRIRGRTDAADDAVATVDPVALLAADDETLMREFGHWYVPRRRAEYLRRNALVVLGNVGDPDRDEVRNAVATALENTSPIVRGHAVWAARRLGFDKLVEAHEDDSDEVMAELDGVVDRRTPAAT
jgi:epoxyqueuosine reductase